MRLPIRLRRNGDIRFYLFIRGGLISETSFFTAEVSDLPAMDEGRMRVLPYQYYVRRLYRPGATGRHV